MLLEDSLKDLPRTESGILSMLLQIELLRAKADSKIPRKSSPDVIYRLMLGRGKLPGSSTW